MIFQKLGRYHMTKRNHKKPSFSSYFLSLLTILIFSVLPFSNAMVQIPANSELFSDDVSVNIDCEKTIGFFNDFAEINCGPIPNPGIDGVDLTNQFRETGLDFIRNHDFSGPTDISTIFPNMSKDPSDPTSYNFSVSDQYITSIVNAGCDVFYRLGESASGEERLRQPPEDFGKWAEICKHIVMHYNDGWAEGYQYNITYLEIWNEPDLSGFWNGTVQQYYALYETAAVTLKQYDSSLKIGGPCTSSIFNENFTIGFLSFVKENELPLDFYSWHMYASTPYQLYNGSKLVRNLLDTFGFYDAESINTEWNINIIFPQRDKDNAKNAAFTACSLSSFQDAGIDHAFRYRATQDNNPIARFIGFDLSLFTHDGLYKKPALSYLAFNHLISDSPLRLQSKMIDEEQKITCLAGLSEDGKNITLLLSNFETEDTSYEIIIDNLPFDSSYTVTTYLIDDENHLQIVDEFNSDGDQLEFQGSLSRSSVQLIRITNSSILPGEGPVTAEIPWFLKIPLFDPLAKILGILFMLIFFG